METAQTRHLQDARHLQDDRHQQDGQHQQDTPTLSFEPVWASLRETDRIIKELDKNQKETSRIIMKNAQLIGKLARQNYPNTRYIIRQLETMCYL